LNAETLKNAFSKERKLLLNLIRQYGEVEYLHEMFASADSERQADLDVALVWLKKSSSFEQDILGNILEDLSRDQATDDSLS
jgi:SHS2 domain-containing protein